MESTKLARSVLLEETPEAFADKLEGGTPITYSTNLLKQGLLELLQGLPEKDDYYISIKRHNGSINRTPVSLDEFLENTGKHTDISSITGICVQRVTEEVGEVVEKEN